MTLVTKTGIDSTTEEDKDLDTLAKAVVQAYKTYLDYKNNLYPQFPYKSDKRTYLLVLTLEEWYIGFNPHFLEKIDGLIKQKLVSASMSEDLISEVPFYFSSIDHFETHGQGLFQMGISQFYKSIADSTYPEKAKAFIIRNIIQEDFTKDLMNRIFE